MVKSFSIYHPVCIVVLFCQLSIFDCQLSNAQVGGTGTYQFLNLTNSARIAAMGGSMLAIKDQDISIAVVNPSLIGPGIDERMTLSFVDYYSDINYGYAMFSKTLPKYGSFIGSMQFIDYGKFKEADATGAVMGEFQAGEYALNLGWGRDLDSNFSIGAIVKIVHSNMAGDISYGLGVDVAGSYSVSPKNFTVSLVARNVGRQLKAYRNAEIEPFPFHLDVGVSKRLKHLPFRYSIVYTRLDKYDLSYEDPTVDKVDKLTNEPIEEDKVGDFFDKLGRHFVVGGEFLPTKT